MAVVVLKLHHRFHHCSFHHRSPNALAIKPLCFALQFPCTFVTSVQCILEQQFNFNLYLDVEGTGAVPCQLVSGCLLGESFTFKSFLPSPPFSWMALITCYNYPNVDCKISWLESCNRDPYEFMSEQISVQQGRTRKKMEKKSFACLLSKHLRGKGSRVKQAETRTPSKSSHSKAASLKVRNREFAEYVGKMQTSKFGKVAQVERREWMREKKEEMIVEEWKRFARVVDRCQLLHIRISPYIQNTTKYLWRESLKTHFSSSYQVHVCLLYHLLPSHDPHLSLPVASLPLCRWNNFFDFQQLFWFDSLPDVEQVINNDDAVSKMLNK